MEIIENIGFPAFGSFKFWFDKRTHEHPFKMGKDRGPSHDDFAQGKVPIEFLKEYAEQYFIFIQATKNRPIPS